MNRSNLVRCTALLASMVSSCGESGANQPGDIYRPGGWDTGTGYATDSGDPDAEGSDAAPIPDAATSPADPECIGWYQFLADNCATEPIDPLAMCEAIESLKVNAGCVTQYDALLSCVTSHQSEWVCNPSFCTSEAGDVEECVYPYCTEHPEECDTP